MFKNEILRSSMLELIQTAVFVFYGTGSVLATGEFLGQESFGVRGVSSILPISLTFGMTITVLAYGFGHLSGSHINPAVTLSLVLIGECDIFRGLCYFIAQLVGAVLGSSLLYGSTSEMSFTKNGTLIKYVSNPPFNLGANELNGAISAGNGFLLELMGTFLLCTTVLMTVKHGGNLTQGKPSIAPLAIGLAVFLAHAVLVPFTGCGINPARSFGPAVVCAIAGKDVFHSTYWIYWVGPIAGASLSAVLHTLVKPYEVPENRSQTVVQLDESPKPSSINIEIEKA